MHKIIALSALVGVLLLSSCRDDRTSGTLSPDASLSGSSTGTLLSTGSGMQLPPRSDAAVPGSLIIKVSEESLAAVRLGTFSAPPLEQSGGTAAPLSIALRSIRTTEVERLFPPAGKYEERSVREGMHRWLRITFDSKMPVTEAMQSLYGTPGVEVIEYERKLQPTALREDVWRFNDPLLPQQYHYNNLGRVNGGVMGADINLINAWEIETGKPGVIVCVVDGAVNVTHPDLEANIWHNEAELAGAEGVDDDDNGRVDDFYGWNWVNNSNQYIPESDFHGTHVAGTVAARNNNGIGVAGVAGGDGTEGSGVRVMTSAIFSGVGEGGNAAAAIKYGADNGAVISQNSWGYTSPGPTPASVKSAIDYFRKYAGCDNAGNQLPDSPMKGGVVIFAAGNSNSEERYGPAEYEPVIAVAAMGPGFERASYSNYGTWVDITAPGGDQDSYGLKAGVLSTYNPADTYAAGVNGYAWYQGTSMACPHVSGIAALIVSHSGGQGFTSEMLEERLLAAVHDIDVHNPKYQGKMGVGYVDARLALTLENKHQAPGSPIFLPEKSPADQFLSTTIHWTVPTDPDDGAPSRYHLYMSETPLDTGNYTEGTLLGNVGGYISGDGLDAGEEMSYEVKGLSPGTTYHFAIVAEDRWGLRSEPAFMEAKTKVNTPPSITNVPADPILLLDIDGSVDYRLEVKEPDGQSWSFDSEGETTGISLSQTETGIGVRIRPVLSHGEYAFTVILTDELGGSASFEIPFRIVNVTAPKLIAPLPSALTGVENGPLTVDLSKTFEPQEMLELTYKASSSDGSVASATVSGTTLTIEAYKPGKVTISIIASNGYKETRTHFDLSVTQDKEADVYAVWPLPLKEKLHFWVNPLNTRPTLTLHSLTGEKILERELLVDHEGMGSVELKGLAPGTYRLRITGSGPKAYERVVQKI